jgi:hypothetical protein
MFIGRGGNASRILDIISRRGIVVSLSRSVYTVTEIVIEVKLNKGKVVPMLNYLSITP